MNEVDYKDFREALYHGADIELSYNNMFYFICSAGDTKDNVINYSISVEKFDKSIFSGEESDFYELLFDESSSNVEELMESCLNVPIFEGKNFYDLKDEIELLGY